MEKNNEFEPLTFDEILEDKEYQAEFDRRITKAIQTNTKKMQEEFQAELEKFKQEGSEEFIAELKEKYENERAELEAKISDYETELKNTQLNATLEKELLKSGAIDTVAVKAHLQDFLSEAEFADGEIKGLVEKLNEFKEEKKHLFNEAEASGVKHREPIKKDTLQDEVFKKMGVK